MLSPRDSNITEIESEVTLQGSDCGLRRKQAAEEGAHGHLDVHAVSADRRRANRNPSRRCTEVSVSFVLRRPGQLDRRVIVIARYRRRFVPGRNKESRSKEGFADVTKMLQGGGRNDRLSLIEKLQQQSVGTTASRRAAYRSSTSPHA